MAALSLILCLIPALPMAGESPETAAFLSPPRIAAASGIMVDAITGTILWEKDADRSYPPASLTKLMAMHLALMAIDSGLLSADQLIPIRAEDCADNLDPESTLLFLEPGMSVSLKELLEGMAIASGNDAALCVSRALGGSPSIFAESMTQEARSLGMTRTSFIEPTGISPLNTTTARDFATFCRAYLLDHPETINLYHSRKSLSFPKLSNMPASYVGAERPILQRNRNGLLFSYLGCDGLKTGYIEESGFNVALTARRDGTRLIVVLLGGPGKGSAEGSRIREEDGSRILDYGFSTFITLHPAVQLPAPIRVWKGKSKLVALRPSEELALTLRREEAQDLIWDIEVDDRIIAPVSAGEPLGRIIFRSGGVEKGSIDLVAADDVKRGNIFKVIWDSIVLWWKGLWGN